MGEAVRRQMRGEVLVVTVDNPPVNALSAEVRGGLLSALQAAQDDPAVRAVVLSCAGRTFIAGADIREFGKPPQPPDLPLVISAFEMCSKPTVAALFGSALGGGLEVALGCHFRVASPGTQCGFPEIKLGILPGSGGTQRTPRLVGIEHSLELILSGEPVSAQKAMSMGLVDAVVEGDLVDAAVAFAQDVLQHKRPLRRLSEQRLALTAADDAALAKHLAAIKKKPALEAPPLALDAVRCAATMSFAEGAAYERSLFMKLRSSEQSAALRHVFFAERAAAKVPGLDRLVKALPVRRVGVVGAGTMGAGIATCFARAGMDVVLLDRESQAVTRGLSTVQKNFDSFAKRGQLSADEQERAVARVSGSERFEDLADADLIVEAVFEEMSLKQDIFQRLSSVCRPDAILATNTSTLDVNVIADSSARPEQVVGMHFFSPAHIMKLLEVVQGRATSAQVMATAMALGTALGKIAVPVGVCHGFVGNRMLYPYRREALFLVEEGASPARVDGVLTRFGMPMGPFAMSDLAGLDIGYRVRQAQGRPKNERYSGTVADRLVEMGRLGQKSGAGFYRYEAGDRRAHPDAEVDTVIAGVAEELGISRRQISDEEILERCLYALINEGAKLLGEGIAHRGSDVDVVWIHGYGFPAHKGGPLYYADTVGLSKVLARVEDFCASQGALWEPAPLLVERAAAGGSLSRA